MSKGFLGTAAPRGADLTLLAESAMGLALIMGAMLARRRWYRSHGWCQSIVVLLNLVVIAAYMVPSFRRQVVPAIPADLGDSAYILAAAHGSAGLIAELLALYILLAGAIESLFLWFDPAGTIAGYPFVHAPGTSAGGRRPIMTRSLP